MDLVKSGIAESFNRSFQMHLGNAQPASTARREVSNSLRTEIRRLVDGGASIARSDALQAAAPAGD
jgi:hypothetical protein